MGFDLGSIAGGLAKGFATPIADAWARTKESQAAIHTIDKQTDRDITVASFTADVQFAQAQRLLNEADKTHWSTRWMRPAFGALAFVWAAAEIWFWLKGYRAPVELDPVVKYLLAGIVGSLFLLRPLEKNRRADLAASVAKAPPKPSLLSRVTTGRSDNP